MSKFKSWLLFLLTTVVFYGASVQYGFSQDDFFHLVISRGSSIKDLLNFFVPHPDLWVFYRPLSTQLWYWLFTALFGWQNAPLPMHLASLVIHATNAYLIASLLEKVFKVKPRYSVIGGVLYALSSLHFLSLFYIGATQQLLMTFFGLLTIHANISNQKIREVTFFILSLLSKELAIRLSPIIFLIRLIKGDSFKTSFKKTLPVLAVSLLYLAFRYLTGVTTPPEYQLDLSPLTSLATLMWYVLMSLGAPEKILSYGLAAGRVDLLRYLHDFPLLGSVNLAGIAVLLLSLLLTRWSRKHFWYGLLWLAGLAPILFFPTHRYAHYLDLSLIPLLALLLTKSNKWLLYVGITAFILSSLSGQLIDRATHWTIERAIVAKQYEEILPQIGACQAKTLDFVGSNNRPQELSYALMLENGPQIICNNSDLRVYYTESVIKNSFTIQLDK